MNILLECIPFQFHPRMNTLGNFDNILSLEDISLYHTHQIDNLFLSHRHVNTIRIMRTFQLSKDTSYHCKYLKCMLFQYYLYRNNRDIYCNTQFPSNTVFHRIHQTCIGILWSLNACIWDMGRIFLPHLRIDFTHRCL